MQLLVFLNSFKREKGENAFPLCMLVDDHVLHPAVWRATVVLHTKSVRKSEIFGEIQTKNRVN